MHEPLKGFDFALDNKVGGPQLGMLELYVIHAHVAISRTKMAGRFILYKVSHKNLIGVAHGP